MKAASDISVRKGLLSAADAKRIENLLANLGLPTEIPADKQKLMDALGKDKKREGDIVHFVLLNGIGNAVAENISIRELLHG
jgi:3-dehydroquinate synthase